MTFAVGSEVGLQSSSDFSQMGKPFLMGTVALGKTGLSSFLSLCLCGFSFAEAAGGLTFQSSCYQSDFNETSLNVQMNRFSLEKWESYYYVFDL